MSELAPISRQFKKQLSSIKDVVSNLKFQKRIVGAAGRFDMTKELEKAVQALLDAEPHLEALMRQGASFKL